MNLYGIWGGIFEDGLALLLTINWEDSLEVLAKVFLWGIEDDEESILVKRET